MNSDQVPAGTERRRECYLLKETIPAPTASLALDGAIFCEKTFAVAAAITCGASIVKGGYARVTDLADLEHTQVVYNLESLPSIEFAATPAETIDTAELVSRVMDSYWCRTNPDHPIAYMHFCLRNYAQLVRAIKSHGLLIMIRKGRRRCYVVAGGDETENRRILAANKFTPDEIETIITTIP